MISKPTTLLSTLVITTLILLYLYSSVLSPSTRVSPFAETTNTHYSKPVKAQSLKECDLFKGQWVYDPKQRNPIYNDTCPFHRNAWNCIRNGRDKMGSVNSWKWVPHECELGRIDPVGFLSVMRNKNVGFVGDSLNENFLVSLLCVLNGGGGGKKWKRKGAWRGGYFPLFNVTVAYHRAVLLAKYQWVPKEPNEDGPKGIYRVDVDIPADDWVNITKFYDVLIFNTGHWWGPHKFPKETPLVFYREGQPILHTVDFMDGLKVVLKSMVSYIEKEVPSSTLKFWRLQSPRHFYGGEWNQNGSCLFDEPLKESQLDMWFDPRNKGVNKEAREINRVTEEVLVGSSIRKLDLTHLSEYRADAHPAVWLGKKGAVEIWGQDCMHWCLPGVPDTWVDILSNLILRYFGRTT